MMEMNEKKFKNIIKKKLKDFLNIQNVTDQDMI